ncbi:unnamed protein product [Eruca vesicaria subsp. sativa]|uniref:Uncharacterized protein n=1 Tax=Eruca vesicaria subsp. sativa TaxID=29727 RepID=A0ABC8M2U4_ERUVS|nr:unnamed protein product [Eruca vesicaria subsp. sativa]
MIMKPVEDIYPKWDNVNISTDLDNMIKDILNGQLNEKFWDATPTTKCEKGKYGVAASVVPNQSPSTKRIKDKQPADGGEAPDMSPSSKRRKGKQPDDGGEAADVLPTYNVAIHGLVESVKILTAKIEGIDVSLAESLEANIEAKVEARMRVYDSDLRKQIAKLEAQITDILNNKDANIARGKVTTSKAYEVEDDGASSNDLSWIVQKKINSQDGLPVDCVVKKETKAMKKMDSSQNLSNKEVEKTEKKAEVPLRRVKQEKVVKIPQLNDDSLSSEDCEHLSLWEKSVTCRTVLAALVSNLE